MHQEQDESADPAECLPPHFICNDSVLLAQGVRVFKCQRGRFKIYAVFPEIPAVFRLIPLEAHRS